LHETSLLGVFRLGAGVLILLFLVFRALCPIQQRRAARSLYGIGGSAVSDLTNNPAFMLSILETIQPTFEAPTEFAEYNGHGCALL
jgi:hypothetical protein